MKFWIIFCGIIVVVSAVYNGNLAYQCMQSGDPKSKACFKYSIATTQMNQVVIWDK